MYPYVRLRGEALAKYNCFDKLALIHQSMLRLIFTTTTAGSDVSGQKQTICNAYRHSERIDRLTPRAKDRVYPTEQGNRLDFRILKAHNETSLILGMFLVYFPQLNAVCNERCICNVV